MKSLCVASVVLFFLLTHSTAQQCEQSSDVARFNCFPEGSPTEEKCEARTCCWQAPFQQFNFSYLADPGVPSCYYPSDFPTYEVTSNQSTDFGQRLHLKIYDPSYQRYEVPLEVPVVTKKADTTDYDVVVKSKPFSILVTRKSTGATL